MSEQLDLFTAARRTDPATSQANRDAFRKKASQRDVILRTYYDERRKWDDSFETWTNTDGGLTDEECGMKTPWKESTMYVERVCYWKRCSELRKLGFIEPTGWTRKSFAGQEQQVCEITVEGIDYVEELIRRGAF